MCQHRLCRIMCLLACLAGLAPTSSQAAPDLARATATVSARVLTPVSVGVSYTASSRQARIKVSGPNRQVYQLHIGQGRQHSYQQAPSQQGYPLPSTASPLKLAKNDTTQPPVTVYFN